MTVNGKFYEFTQNNSGGSFITNDKVCHRLFIEADSASEANSIAEDLGVYFDGVEYGDDCSCCGDRWYRAYRHVDLEKFKQEGYDVSIYGGYGNTEWLWYEKYGNYQIVESPQWIKSFSISRFAGKIAFSNIEEYVQYLANEYSATEPETRIFYKDGRVVEINSSRVR